MTYLRVFLVTVFLLAPMGLLVSVLLSPSPVLAGDEKADLPDINTASSEKSDVQVKLAFDYIERYWNLGNMIAAFTVAQMLGFLYALGEKETILNGVRKQRTLVVFCTIASSLIYGVLVLLCYLGETIALEELSDSTSLTKTSKYAMWGRVLIIGLTTIGGLIILFLEWKSCQTKHPKYYLTMRSNGRR